jgi:hypothetical protein
MLGGGGSPEKDWVMATSLLGASGKLDIVMVDISHYMIHGSISHLRRRLAKDGLSQNVTVWNGVCDFLKLDELFVRRKEWQHVVWNILGGTIGNVSEREFFRSIKGPSRVGDLLVVGLDTLDGLSDKEFEQRMADQYRSREVDDLLLSPVRWIAPERQIDDPERRVTVSVAGGAGRGNPHSDVPNTRTVVCSTSPPAATGPATILATSTRYRLEDFLIYARRFGWEHLGTQQASSVSTFRQLLLRRVE